MTCEYIFRDISDIYSRLFNHRAALHGLTNNFVKEFEEKRGDGERVSLLRTLDLVTDCRDRSYPETLELVGSHVTELSESVKKTSVECNRILKDEEEKKTDWLQNERKRREHEWQEFMAAQAIRKERADADFAKTVSCLEQQYKELEEKLKGGKKVL